jgi:single-stranded DNA-binding protein
MIPLTASVNKVLLVGILSPKGVEVRYLDSGTAVASFALELPEPGQDGKMYKTLVFCEVYGKRAEAASEIAPGAVCAFEGKLRRQKRGEHWETVVAGFELAALTPGVAAPAGRH